MKVSSTELPPRQVSLAIEVEQDRLDRAMDDAFRRLAGRVDVPGFRRGKAPRSMVERIIGRERIVEEALETLLPVVVGEAIEQEKVEAYLRPRVESIEFDPLRLKAIIGLAPKVELGDYRDNLRVQPEAATVGDEQIDTVIERLRESYAQWAPVERQVEPGDRVGLDLQATSEGHDKPLLDSKEAEYVVDSEGAQPAPGFAQQLVGLCAGDQKSFTLTMPDDYRQKDVAGQPAAFKVTVHWVKERELPTLDDAFAEQVGDYTDVASLRSAIETQLRTREQERVREQLEAAAMSKLVESSSIEFPPQLIDHEAQHMLETLTRSIEQQGLQLAQYLRLVGKEQAEFEQEIRSEAELRVRRSLALDAFADAEQIGAEAPEASANTRERRAMARLLELATADGRDGGDTKVLSPAARSPEKPAKPAETSDTGTASPEPMAPTASEATSGEKDRQTP